MTASCCDHRDRQRAAAGLRWSPPGFNIAGSTARIVGQGHRGAAEHVDVGHYAALGQPFTKPAEGLLDALAIKQRRRFAHAASIS